MVGVSHWSPRTPSLKWKSNKHAESGSLLFAIVNAFGGEFVVT